MVDQLDKPNGLGQKEFFIDFAGRLDGYQPEEVLTTIGDVKQATLGHLSTDLPLTIIATSTSTKGANKTAVIFTTYGLFEETRRDPRISETNQQKLYESFQRTLKIGIRSGRITP
jgi:hypothetical protein